MAEMPEEIFGVYQELKNEVTWLHAKWKIYRQLYAKSEKRVNLLNEVARAFFYIIEQSLRSEISIYASKLTDPARSRKFENLSLYQLQERIAKNCDADFSSGSQELLDIVKERCAPLRNWRDKKLAHLDLNVAMNTATTPLPSFSRKEIGGAISSIAEYMNNIEGYYNDSHHAYEMVSIPTDANALIEMLKWSMRYEELRSTGKIAIDDWSLGDWRDA
ncbi:hypothetical protein [Azospirillum thiophilum]|uniref:AbiU2 domain-containing protein n=1 Tax=Azospirillum thiophilum TaxID=528244 RepID=UPI000A8A55C0|nr:hypothetical protein [Azospirillum thiophilum]